MKTPVIMCAICKKPVDSLEWWDDKASDVRIIRAKCHGDRDEMRIGLDDLYQMSRNGFPSEGVAFSTKRLEITK